MRIVIQTLKIKEIVDITDLINTEIKKTGKKSGLCSIFIKHTTASFTTADLDPGTDLDMLDAFEKIVPHLKYRHPHNPKHVPDHIMSSIIGPSLVLPITNRALDLGTWQRVILVELDGPRERQVVVSVF